MIYYTLMNELLEANREDLEASIKLMIKERKVWVNNYEEIANKAKGKGWLDEYGKYITNSESTKNEIHKLEKLLYILT